MKQIVYFLAFTAFLFVLSCNQDKSKSKQTDKDIAKADISDQCFLAVHEKDTADLKIRTAKDGKVTGDLVIKYGELKPNALEKGLNRGAIEGKFRGDTLFADYTFTSGTKDKTIYKNPLAFLKRGEQLILGVGEIETYVGRTYFKNDKPINFEIGKFRFEPVDCKR